MLPMHHARHKAAGRLPGCHNQSRNAAESFLDPLRTEPGGHDDRADRSRRQKGRLDSSVKRREVKSTCQFSFRRFFDRAAGRASFQPAHSLEWERYGRENTRTRASTKPGQGDWAKCPHLTKP
jgi:hypothetical protein